MKFLLLATGLCVLTVLFGCYQGTPPVTRLTEAHKKFQTLCKEDLGLATVITPLQNTLYVYVPVEFDIFKIQASKPGMTLGSNPTEKRVINFLETAITDNILNITYDISTSKIYPKTLGYGSSYSEQFSQLHSNLLSALFRSFSEVETPDQPMDFIVILIIDTRNGVGVKYVLYFQDLKQAMSGSTPMAQSEYVNRIMTEMIGEQLFVDNKTGRGLDYHDWSWPEFIAQQITYRINFKYQRSDFPPTDSNLREIMRVVGTVLGIYDFRQADTFQLNDLGKGETYQFNIDQLATFQTDL
ncbi:MAG TPA: hypothetical protein VLJ10_01020 [Candidatus Bathyarchaeia archaeon]|nr:hypothetical protein [Candidatus Bathyarchaeia archaeon]